MKIALTSDAHQSRRWMDALLDMLPPVDALCFLGDLDGDGVYLSYGLAERHPRAAFHAVAGNNDPFSPLPASIMLDLGGVRTLLTHGHRYAGIRSNRDTLAAGAASLGCTLALYGHTHAARDERIRGVRLINPGALLQRCWALVEVTRAGVEVSFMQLG